AKRSQSLKGSELDSVAGLGKTRKMALLRHFGSVRRMRSATVSQLTEVAGIGPALAHSIVATLTGVDPDAARPHADDSTDDSTTGV
ncbi:MAG: helix-hairpin-helix domain-containing protein, partial [Pseudonocardiaceae bacterium]